MPSVKNPNTVSRNRQIARAAKARKQSLKRLSASKLANQGATRVEKADLRRGARVGLLPTSGPNRALSKKKQRKVEKQLAHAIRRKAEADAAREVEMEGKPLFFSEFTWEVEEGKGKGTFELTWGESQMPRLLPNRRNS